MQVFKRYKREVEVTKTRMVPETYTVVEEEPVIVLELTHNDVRNLADAVREGYKLIGAQKTKTVAGGQKVMQDIIANWNSGEDELRKEGFIVKWPSV